MFFLLLLLTDPPGVIILVKQEGWLQGSLQSVTHAIYHILWRTGVGHLHLWVALTWFNWEEVLRVKTAEWIMRFYNTYWVIQFKQPPGLVWWHTQTGHKQDTNRTQTGHKQDTNRTLTHYAQLTTGYFTELALYTGTHLWWPPCVRPRWLYKTGGCTRQVVAILNYML